MRSCVFILVSRQIFCPIKPLTKTFCLKSNGDFSLTGVSLNGTLLFSSGGNLGGGGAGGGAIVAPTFTENCRIFGNFDLKKAKNGLFECKDAFRH